MNIPLHHTTPTICPQKLLAELDKALDTSKEVTECLQMAHFERREARDGRDGLQYHVEWEGRKEAESQVGNQYSVAAAKSCDLLESCDLSIVL